MSYKVVSLFYQFKFHRLIHKGVIKVEWMLYNPEGDNGERAVGFSHEQAQKVTNFMAGCFNFNGPKDYHPVDEEELPLTVPWDFIPDPSRRTPDYLVLTKEKKPTPKTGISPYMDVVLMGVNGAVQHHYDLDFSMIGKILKA